MLILRHGSQRGFTLVELMIGILVGMLVVAAAIAIYVTTVRGSAETLRMVKLNQELSNIMAVMVSDIRRAGYWANMVTGNIDNPLDNEPDLVDPATDTQIDPDNPFTVRDADIASDAGLPGTTDINILDGGSCILYAYDATYRAGSTFAVDATDYFGFRLNGNSIQMPTASPSTTLDCTAGTWQTVNDNNTVSIDGLLFSTVGSKCRNTRTNASWTITNDTTTIPACECTGCTGYVAPTAGDILVETRQILITLEGSHVSDPNMQAVYIEQVKLRNNRVFVAD